MNKNFFLFFPSILLLLATISLACSRSKSDRPYVPSTGTGTGTDSGSGSSTGYNIADYLNFDHANYAYWEYTSDGVDYMYTCMDPIALNGYSCWPMRLSVNSTNLIDEFVTLDTGDLLFIANGTVIPRQENTLDPPIRLGLASMRVGQSWSDNGTYSEGGGITYSAQSSLKAVNQSVSWTSGTLISDNCIEIETIYHLEAIPTLDITYLRYYVLGGGLVKYSINDSATGTTKVYSLSASNVVIKP